jgi:hypothetical protein
MDAVTALAMACKVRGRDGVSGSRSIGPLRGLRMLSLLFGTAGASRVDEGRRSVALRLSEEQY